MYGAAEAAGVVTVPPLSFQRFCFKKVEYMQQLVASGVPISPTLFVTPKELLAEFNNVKRCPDAAVQCSG